MLPAVKPRIDGPLAGPDQGQCNAKHGQSGGNTRMGRRRGKCHPRLGARRNNPSNGRPQADDEKQASQSSDYLRRRSRATGRGAGTVQKSGARQQALNQQSGARPAACER